MTLLFNWQKFFPGTFKLYPNENSIPNLKKDYKNINIGNNISNKTLDEVEDYILNISSYKAKLEVTINSNKNTNK